MSQSQCSYENSKSERFYSLATKGCVLLAVGNRTAKTWEFSVAQVALPPALSWRDDCGLLCRCGSWPPKTRHIWSCPGDDGVGGGVGDDGLMVG